MPRKPMPEDKTGKRAADSPPKRLSGSDVDANDSGEISLERWLDARFICAEARRLLDMFGEAVEELIALHEQQFQAVVAGERDANRFDLLIHGANERKRQAKYLYLTHLREHGCNDQKATYASGA